MISRLSLLVAALVGCALVGGASAAPEGGAGLTVERVVLIMRHGVRPPTKNPPMVAGIAHDAWPSWDVAPGELTTHGAKGIALMGGYQRQALAREGLFPADGCPPTGQVRVVADSDQRTIRTGEVFSEAFAPGCAIAVTHKTQGELDQRFSPFDGPVEGFSQEAARRAVIAGIGPGGLAARARSARPALAAVQRAYGCCSVEICAGYKVSAPCNFTTLPTTLTVEEGSPEMSGALDLGSTASQILLLEYVDGKPMSQVGWGRVTKADIQAGLALHSLEYDLVARPPYISRRGAAALLEMTANGLGPDGPRLTLLVGHDTNIAHIGGALNLRWKIADYPAGDPPPGGALGFEVVRDKAGARYVRAFYTAQSMDQLRDLSPLDLAHPPARQDIAIGNCKARRGNLCPLAAFLKLAARTQ